LAEEPSMGLELVPPRPPKADAALLPFEVSPAPNQAAGQMRELRQFDLQLSLKTSRSLGKDVENQAVTIQNSTVRQFLEIALLAGSQRLIDQHHVGIVG